MKVAPTLVKYAAANPYQQETRRELEQAARELMAGAAIDPAPLVDLVERGPSLEVEIAATLLYGACHYPFRQVRERVAALPEAKRDELIDLGVRHRGRHDELLRGFAAGPPLRFDILMDIGGFRDMHRHRRCLQTLQSFTAAHGFDVPEGLAEAGLVGTYEAATAAAHEAFAVVAASDAPEAEATARYLLPLGTRCRVALPDGLCRSALHQRAAFRAAGAFFLPASGVGDVPGGGAAASGAGAVHAGDGCAGAGGFAEAMSGAEWRVASPDLMPMTAWRQMRQALWPEMTEEENLRETEAMMTAKSRFFVRIALNREDKRGGFR